MSNPLRPTDFADAAGVELSPMDALRDEDKPKVLPEMEGALYPWLPLPPEATGLPGRLEWCAERVGGKRKLAELAEISESQLYRYLEPEATIPHDRLIALAHAADASPAWLLTGVGDAQRRRSRPRPEFRPALLVTLQEHIQTLLAEYQSNIPISSRSRMTAYLYEVLRQEEVVSKRFSELDKFKLLAFISFLAEVKSEAELDILREAFELITYQLQPNHPLSHQHHQLLTTWCNLLVRGLKGYYNSYAGQVYFDRMGLGLDTDAVQDLHALVTLALQAVKKPSLSWLDVGCGNGRHLAHLHKHMPNLTLAGLELSDLGLELCKRLEQSERLPMGCVKGGDIRLAPYPSAHFDVVYSRMTLHHLPNFAGLDVGFCEGIQEIQRITKPQGLVISVLPLGHHQHFSLPSFGFSAESYQRYFEKGWKMLQQKTLPWNTHSRTTQRSFQHAFDGYLLNIHQKVA